MDTKKAIKTAYLRTLKLRGISTSICDWSDYYFTQALKAGVMESASAALMTKVFEPELDRDSFGFPSTDRLNRDSGGGF